MIEISSDSDDDCYDKLPQKLQRLKKKHALNSLLNNFETDDVCLISKQNSDVSPVFNAIEDHSSVNSFPIEIETPAEEICTRSRRSKRKNSDNQSSPVALPQKGGKRGRGRGRGKCGQSSVPVAPQPRGTTRRGKGTRNVTHTDSTILNIFTPSSRGRRSQRRGRQQTQSYITYSVGNTDEYPDASDNLKLFSNKNDTIEPRSDIIDLDESLENEELSVKVFWQHSEVIKFNIRRFQKLTQIFEFFMNKESVSKDRLLLTYDNKESNKILTPDDTPDSIGYSIANFIEGGIVNHQISVDSSDTPKQKGFIIKFQCQNKKKPFELSIGKDEKLQLAMVKCAEHLEIPKANLIFEFDGETINGSATPKDLDMDSGDCIDVKIGKLK